MYFIVFKNLLPLTNIKNAEELGIKFDFLGPQSQRENIEVVLHKMVKETKTIHISPVAIKEIVENSDDIFRESTPMTLVTVKRDYDENEAYELMLVLSYIQGYPASPFFVLYIMDNQAKYFFIPDRKYKYGTNTLFPQGTTLDLNLYLKKASRYVYILELLREANQEERNGLKIAKYFSILETLASKYNSERTLYGKLKLLFEEHEFRQPFIPDQYKVDFNSYHNKLKKYYLERNKFSYMEVLIAYRNLVVHYGDLEPSVILDVFDSRNELIDLLEFGVYMIIKGLMMKE